MIPVWSFVILAILLVTGPTVTAYLIYRKRQKKKVATGIFQNVLITEFIMISYFNESVNKSQLHVCMKI